MQQTIVGRAVLAWIKPERHQVPSQSKVPSAGWHQLKAGVTAKGGLGLVLFHKEVDGG